ncbi:MAG: CAP domain-containing protein [Cellvibrionales bacterium]|nr:CAP domain-containing protein [Cellvibrionales bacterium]
MKNILALLFMLSFLTACLDDTQVTSPIDSNSTNGSDDNGDNNGGDDGNDGGNGNPPTGDMVNLDCSNQGNIVGNRFDLDAKKYILCLHNKFRSDTAKGNVPAYGGNLPMATNMQALSWDSTLEQVAQNYANQCQWQHNDNRTDDFVALNGNPEITYVGENIAFYASTNNPMSMIRVQEMFDAMATGEAINWSFGTIGNTEYCDQGQCGHATQMFWANTQFVGCAITHCDPTMVPNPEFPFTDIYMVCNYGQSGNYQNQTPYVQALSEGAICSDNRSNTQTECTEGLTHANNYDDGL